jgi:siderophore synthetase component
MSTPAAPARTDDLGPAGGGAGESGGQRPGAGSVATPTGGFAAGQAPSAAAPAADAAHPAPGPVTSVAVAGSQPPASAPTTVAASSALESPVPTGPGTGPLSSDTESVSTPHARGATVPAVTAATTGMGSGGTDAAGTAPSNSASNGTTASGPASNGTVPSGADSAGAVPAGAVSSGAGSAGAVPAGAVSSGAGSNGTAPLGTGSASTVPAGAGSAGAVQAGSASGAVPTGSASGTVPTGSAAGAVQAGSAAGAVPTGSASGTVPTGSVSNGTVPTGSVSNGAAPLGAGSAGPVFNGAAPDGTGSACTASVSTAPAGPAPSGAGSAGAAGRSSASGADPAVPSVPLQRPGIEEAAPSTAPRRATGAASGDDPGPYALADAAGTDNLLRCWVRETGVARPGNGVLRIPLPASGAELRTAVDHWSATGQHRFGPAHLGAAGATGPSGRPLTAVELAALLAREGRDSGGADPAESSDLVARVADSVRRTAGFLADRRERPGPAAPALPFLDSEQALVLGHALHPTPKGREGLSEGESAAYSPELRGSFPLHWLAVDRRLLATDSAWTDRGRTVPAADLLAPFAGPGLRLPDGTAPLPLHPWQARDIRHRPEVRALFDAGLLHDLGPLGEPWHPTSSVRTVYRPGAPAMLKLSLGLRITNSRRENLRKELVRGTEVHRLLRSGLATQWQAVHPGFDIVRDPAWLAVDGLDGAPVRGLDVVLRHSPFGPGDQAHCVAGLVSPRPWPGVPAPGLRSRLAVTVARLAEHTGRPGAAVAAEWFLRYLEAVVRPVLWLDGQGGIALEAHQQNTLVLLDADGWPCGGRYRDNQGYYFRESHRAALDRRLPGIGAASDTFVSDEVADERFAYYVGINNVFGLIGAFGAQGLADEELLLAAFRRFLGTATGHGSSLPERLMTATHLRCKANLLTRLHGMDELDGPVDTQSVYVTTPNPLAR